MKAANKNLHSIFVANDLELVEEWAANFSLGWRTDIQQAVAGRGGGEIPTARLSGNHIQVPVSPLPLTT